MERTRGQPPGSLSQRNRVGLRLREAFAGAEDPVPAFSEGAEHQSAEHPSGAGRSDREILEALAHKIRRHRLETPVALLLQMHAPVANLLFHGWLLCLPAFGPLIGKGVVETISRVLSRRENVIELVRLLEARSDTGSKMMPARERAPIET